MALKMLFAYAILRITTRKLLGKSLFVISNEMVQKSNVNRSHVRKGFPTKQNIFLSNFKIYDVFWRQFKIYGPQRGFWKRYQYLSHHSFK